VLRVDLAAAKFVVSGLMDDQQLHAPVGGVVVLDLLIDALQGCFYFGKHVSRLWHYREAVAPLFDATHFAGLADVGLYTIVPTFAVVVVGAAALVLSSVAVAVVVAAAFVLIFLGIVVVVGAAALVLSSVAVVAAAAAFASGSLAVVVGIVAAACALSSVEGVVEVVVAAAAAFALGSLAAVVDVVADAYVLLPVDVVVDVVVDVAAAAYVLVLAAAVVFAVFVAVVPVVGVSDASFLIAVALHFGALRAVEPGQSLNKAIVHWSVVEMHSDSEYVKNTALVHVAVLRPDRSESAAENTAEVYLLVDTVCLAVHSVASTVVDAMLSLLDLLAIARQGLGTNGVGLVTGHDTNFAAAGSLRKKPPPVVDRSPLIKSAAVEKAGTLALVWLMMDLRKVYLAQDQADGGHVLVTLLRGVESLLECLAGARRLN